MRVSSPNVPPSILVIVQSSVAYSDLAAAGDAESAGASCRRNDVFAGARLDPDEPIPRCKNVLNARGSCLLRIEGEDIGTPPWKHSTQPTGNSRTASGSS